MHEYCPEFPSDDPIRSERDRERERYSRHRELEASRLDSIRLEQLTNSRLLSEIGLSMYSRSLLEQVG